MVQLVVGLIDSKKLFLNQCRFFVIDEADRVLASKQGDQQNALAMFSRLPTRGVQVMLFSGTLHLDDITKMSGKLCTWVDLKGKEYVPDTVHHCIIPIDPKKDRQWQTNKLVRNTY